MIQKISVCDFKSIRRLDLTLGERTVLVGRSGTGKSNIVHAIRFLRNYLLNQGPAIDYEGGWPRIVPVGLANPRTSISVLFSVPGEEQNYEYGLGFRLATSETKFNGKLVLGSERLSAGGAVLLERERNQSGVWQWKTAPPVIAAPAHQDSPMLGAFPSVERLMFAYAALANGIGYYHFPASALEEKNSSNPRESFLNELPGLHDSAANYREVMRRIIQDFHNPQLRKSLLASLKEVNGSVTSLELDSLTHPTRAIVGHSAGAATFQLSLDQESDGFRRFYAHLLALYQTPAKLTLIFEEPENAIFPGALSVLAEEFAAAPRENRGQVILTSHSPSLINAFDVDSLRVVEMQDGETKVGHVAKEQREAVEKHLLTTGELLTVEEPRMEPGKQAA